ncbi:SEC14-like protein 5 [Durusdinium trenchii]|uniref:SEC14-like protein 5 n=1 Tax=Durusdinium trenchii TaxID=1381693 RepID=A0ABP0S1W3_9DINO
MATAAIEVGLTPTSLDELMNKHEDRLEELRAQVESELPEDGTTADGVKVDDLFLLRFLLSNKKMEAAVEKVRATLEWRKKNQKVLESMAAGEPHPLQKDLGHFLFTGTTGCLAGGEPVSVVRMGMSDFRRLMKSYTVDKVAEYLLFEKEKAFRTCDEETRARNRLVKSVTVIDFADFSMFGGRFDNRFFKALGASSKLSSVYFPQLQAKTVAINTPSYYSMVHKTLSAVMPKSSMEKMVMCPAKKTEKLDCSACPFMKANGGAEAVPAFLGGTAPTPPELCPPSQREGEIPFANLKIANRSYAMLELPIEQPDTLVEFEIMVESYHVLVGAELIPYRQTDSFRGFFQSNSTEEIANMQSSTDLDVEDSSLPVEGEDESVGLKVAHHRQRGRRRKKKKQRRRFAKPSKLDDADLNGIQARRRLSLNPKMAPLRLESKDGMTKGTWKIPFTGKLVIKVDNSFSRLRSKNVTYRISTVVPPDDEEEQNWWEQNWDDFQKQVNWPGSANDQWDCTIS